MNSNENDRDSWTQHDIEEYANILIEHLDYMSNDYNPSPFVLKYFGRDSTVSGFVIHDSLQEWQVSEHKYDTSEKAMMFFDEIHKNFYNNYRIAEVVNGKVRETYLYEEFQQIFG